MIHLKEGSFLQGGKYRIVRFINSGGFGCTYEAEHLMFRKRVAIKEFFVKDFCGRDERTACVTVETSNKRGLVDKLKRKFIDEARSIFDLQYPGIVRVTDVFEENGTAYYVMDYIDGMSLKEVVDKEGALPESRALEYIRQVADALDYVHAHNRLHLDIKPGNIMVDQNDRTILIDFGASRQYEEVGNENSSSLIPYTNGYAPPEQVGNDLVQFTPATDVYALGATLYKLLSGVTPVSSSLRNSGEQLLPLPKSINASTRKAVDAAMTLNRHERTQSISLFRNTLLDIVGSEGWKHKVKELYERLPELPIMTKVFISMMIIIPLFGLLVLMADSNNKINGHEYVDLGLSVKWATLNVGAEKPSDYGDYFAWGEVDTKSEYTEDNGLTRGKHFSDISGDSQFDAARAIWGGTWRLPTKEEFEELKDKCKIYWTTQNNRKGYKVTGPNGNSIFFPVPGYIVGKDFDEVEDEGLYWSSTPYKDDWGDAYGLGIMHGHFEVGWDDRDFGYSIRAVTD